MKNLEALKQIPLKDFASMTFHMVRFECSNLQEFEALLDREVKPELEGTVREALQELQCSNSD